ncbi:hypothetical protein IWQ60_006485 [Tieghemiomyces parasiticus]|uniref:CAP-Gly domain-containing protein n=1 Tax=Tieghemiomyces parasiticus TaxID=78921 RepID=A0A9W8DTN1_9FUNG|nr:hypothetical protein IWQ60_006485 [Tieghemiomyces parasiticus]
MSKFSRLNSGLPVPAGLNLGTSREDSPRAQRRSIPTFSSTQAADPPRVALQRSSTGSLLPASGLHGRLSSVSSVTDGESQLSAAHSPPSPQLAHPGPKPPRASLLSPSPTNHLSGLPQFSGLRKSATLSPAVGISASRGAIPAFRKLSLGKPLHSGLGEAPPPPPASTMPRPPLIPTSNNSTPAGSRVATTPLRARLDRNHPALTTPRPESPAVMAARFRTGETVSIPSMNLTGILRFIGPVQFKPGTWAGVELEPIGAGKNDGSVNGIQYFTCPPASGLFVLAQKLQPIEADDDTGEVASPPSPSLRSHRQPTAPRPQPPASAPRPQSRDAPVPGPTPFKLGQRLTKTKLLTTNPRPAAGAHDRQAPSPGPTRPPGRPGPNRRMTLGPGVGRARTSPAPPPGSRSRSPSAPPKPALKPPPPVPRVPGLSYGARRATLNALPGTRLLDTSDSAAPGPPTTAGALLSTPPTRPTVAAADGSPDSHRSPAIPTELFQRVKLKLEMLEAENKVLRLENKQGRTQLEARQLVEKDLLRKQILEELGRTPPAQSTDATPPDSHTSPSLLRAPAPATPTGLPPLGDRLAKLSQKFATIDAAGPSRPGSAASHGSSDRSPPPAASAPEEDTLGLEVLQLTEMVQSKDARIKALEAQIAQARASPAPADHELAERIADLETRLAAEHREAARSVEVIEELKAALAANAEVVVNQKEAIQALISQMDTLVGKALRTMRVLKEADEDGIQSPRKRQGSSSSGGSLTSDETADPLLVHRARSERVSRALETSASAVEHLQKVNHRLSMDLHSVLQERALSPSDTTMTAAGDDWEERYRALTVEHDRLRTELRQKDDLIASLHRPRPLAFSLGGSSPDLFGSREFAVSPAASQESLPVSASSPAVAAALNRSIHELHELATEAAAGPVDVSNEVLGEEVLALRETVAELQARLAEQGPSVSAQGELGAASARFEEVNAELAAARVRQTDLERELAAVQETLSAQAARLDRGTADDSEAALARLQTERDDATRLLEAKNDQLRTVQGAVAKLEARTVELEAERDALLEKCAVLKDGQADLIERVETVEAQFISLAEDCERLYDDNARLTGELATASAQSSMAVDVRALGDTSPSTQAAGDNTPAAAAANFEAARQQHAADLRERERRLRELERAKDQEIEELNQYLGELESLVDNKSFRETDLEDQIAAHLRRIRELESQVEGGSGGSAPATGSSATRHSISTVPASSGTSPRSFAKSLGSPAAPTSTGATNGHINVDADDDTLICELCDAPGHDLFNCPLFKSDGIAVGTPNDEEGSVDADETPAPFKTVPDYYNSSRPFCDNCEMFGDHWTEDCPDQDATF